MVGLPLPKFPRWPFATFTDQNPVRVAAKELTALIIDDERLRAERTDRRSWKSRVTGLDENGPPSPYGSRDLPRPRPQRQGDDDDDAEYRLAIEASKAQEEEDRRKRASRQDEPDDEDLRKALQLSKEEEEARRKELERTTIFDDGDLIDTNAPVQNQNQFTGYGNQGYQQGNPVDFFANPLDANQMQGQPTGYMPNAYTGFQPQQTGFPGGYPNGYGMQQTGFGADPYGQQQQQAFQPQPTGYNPYMQQQQQQQPQPQQQPQQQLQVPSPVPQEAPIQPGSNNPWATNNQNQQQPLKATPTGSNNPFATSFGRPPTSLSPKPSTLGSLPEQKSLSTFNSFNQQAPQPQQQPPPQQHQTPPPFTAPQKDITEHEAKLNTLLSGGEGQDTFGNTGQLRIPAQHTAPGTFVNSAGAGASRVAADATGSNPFLRSQFTGMPAVSYPQAPAATGPAGVNGNPFSGGKQGQGGGDLIQL